MSDNKIQDQPTTEIKKINDLVTAFNTKVTSLKFPSTENEEVIKKLKDSAEKIQKAAQANIPSHNTSILSLELLDNLRMSLIDINNNKDYSQAERNSYRKGILDAIAIANDANNIPKEPSSFQRKKLEKLWKEAQADAENDYIQARKQKATDRAPLKWKDSKNVIALIVASAIVAAILFNPPVLAAITAVGAGILFGLAVIAVATWLTKGQGVNRMINSKNWFSSEVLGGKGGMEHTKQEYMDKQTGKKDDYISSKTNEKNMKDENTNLQKLKATHTGYKGDEGVKSVAANEATMTKTIHSRLEALSQPTPAQNNTAVNVDKPVSFSTPTPTPTTRTSNTNSSLDTSVKTRSETANFLKAYETRNRTQGSEDTSTIKPNSSNNFSPK